MMVARTTLTLPCQRVITTTITSTAVVRLPDCLSSVMSILPAGRELWLVGVALVGVADCLGVRNSSSVGGSSSDAESSKAESEVEEAELEAVGVTCLSSSCSASDPTDRDLNDALSMFTVRCSYIFTYTRHTCK